MFKYVLGLVLITGLSLVGLIFFLSNTDPYSLTTREWIIFYLSLFLFLVGFFTLAGIFLRKARSQFRINWKMVGPAFRQGIILALLLTFSLILVSIIREY